MEIRPPRNFWYAIALSQEVKIGKILNLTRFGEKLILWRNSSGTIACMEDRCPHRGVQLSLGCVKRDELVCFYHGIHYNSSGACTHIPAHGEGAPIPKGLQIKTFTVREQYGLVWIWWGDLEQNLPPIPWFPQVPDRDYDQTRAVVYPVGFIRLMESNFDGYHSEFIHGFKRGTYITSVKCEVQGHLIKTEWENRKQPDVPGELNLVDVIFPGIMYGASPSWKVEGVFTCAPIDDNSTLFTLRYFGESFKGSIFPRFKNWLFRQWAIKRAIPQDVRVQHSQTPKHTGLGYDLPVVNADRGILAYWKILREVLKAEDEKASLTFSGAQSSLHSRLPSEFNQNMYL